MLPILPFERIAKKAGVRRISREAVEELRDTMDEYATMLAEKAVKVSFHAGRRTVKEEDIIFVAGEKR